MSHAEDLAQFLVGPGGVPPVPEAEAARRYVIAGELPGALSTAVCSALVAVLVARRDLDKLALLCEKGPREVAKEARRGLHRLRSHGVKAKVPRAPVAATPVRLPVAEPGEAWATSPDGKGSRMVAVLVVAPRVGFCMIHAQVSDEIGLVDVFSGEGPKRVWRDLRKRFRENSPHLVMADIPVGYAAALIEEGYERSLALGRSPPPEFAHVRAFLPQLVAGEHPALSEIAPASLTPSDAVALHDLGDLASWVPAREHLTTLSLRMGEVATSTLLIDDRQREQARQAVIDRMVETVWDAEGRARYRRRLLDCALLYGRAGYEDDAARLRAQADRLESPEFVAIQDAFARRMVEKLIPDEMRGNRIVAGLDAAKESESVKRTLWTP